MYGCQDDVLQLVEQFSRVGEPISCEIERLVSVLHYFNRICHLNIQSTSRQHCVAHIAGLMSFLNSYQSFALFNLQN